MKHLLASLLLLFVSTWTIVAADAVSELASFSIFDKVDVNELAKSDVKTMPGPPMGGRFLSVQSCYVVPGAPEKHIEALRQWDPTTQRELTAFLPSDLPASPFA